MNRPHVVVFYGGDADSHVLSTQTGQWVCQYVPRESFQVTPVHVTAAGLWQVPLGSLPKGGSVARAMEMLEQAVPALPPSQALERLMNRSIALMMTLVRGPGGDDGSLQSLGMTLSIPTAGSPLLASQLTSNKHMSAHHVEDIVASPLTSYFSRGISTEDVLDDIRSQFMAPLFVKPATAEGSRGIVRVNNADELGSAIARVQGQDDVIVQQHAAGHELSLTLYQDARGKVHVLPATLITPVHAVFYDNLAKQRPGRVKLTTVTDKDDAVIHEAEIIARDVYERLGCRDVACIDMIAGEEGIDLLEVNTVPTFSEATPLKHQLQAGGLHPAQFIDGIIRRNLAGN